MRGALGQASGNPSAAGLELTRVEEGGDGTAQMGPLLPAASPPPEHSPPARMDGQAQLAPFLIPIDYGGRDLQHRM